MDPSLDARVRAFLASHHVMTLAAADDLGPCAAAVFYVVDGLCLHFVSSPRSRHAAALARDPRVAVTIQAEQSDWRAIRGLQLRGEVRPVAPDAREAVRAVYAARFPVAGPEAPEPIAAALQRVGWYTVVPRDLYLVDNARGFAHREHLVVPVDAR